MANQTQEVYENNLSHIFITKAFYPQVNEIEVEEKSLLISGTGLEIEGFDSVHVSLASFSATET